MKNFVPIPVIDIFAGPGGLGEGFSSLTDQQNNRLFSTLLSIEKDIFAHQTLLLRSFIREFKKDEVPDDYYSFMKGELTLDQLYSSWPKQSAKAKDAAWLAELGKEPAENVDRRIQQVVEKARKWVLIGGPPCQAYSLMGRARVRGIDPTDPRVYLYREYFRILAVHSPPVFIMENVKGLLSAEVQEKKIFQHILADLSDPTKAYAKLDGAGRKKDTCLGYWIYSLVKEPSELELDGRPVYDYEDFVIKSENYGIPQTRHRVILLGIRKDINIKPVILKESQQIPTSKVLRGLPRLRSGLSEEMDSGIRWKKILENLLSDDIIKGFDQEIKSEMKRVIRSLSIPENDRGAEFLNCIPKVEYKDRWFIDKRLKGICNHSSRAHMTSDLYRYFYSAAFAKVYGYSPKLSDFPRGLLPDHKNVDHNGADMQFSDRFSVQVWNQPAKTITSHISKDGHYYIHPDPSQCRSLTVREAARIQTFPDNYFFCGPRTSQYTQVGNAVPPLLAKQVAEVVAKVLKKI